MLRKFSALAAISGLLSIFTVAMPAQASEQSAAIAAMLANERVSRELLVELDSNIDPRVTAISSLGLRSSEIAEDTYLIDVPWWFSERYVLAELLKDDSVVAAEPNYLMVRPHVVDDPDYSLQWGHKAADYGADVEGAWAQGVTGSEDVVVAVIDDGVENLHPDLAQNMWVNEAEIPGDGLDNDGNGFIDDIHGWDFGLNTSDVRRNDPDFTHGTHVAGIIAARGNNGIGVAGVAYTSRVMALGIFDYYSDGGETYISAANSDIVAAIDYLVEQKKRGVNVVAANNSYGGTGYSTIARNAFLKAGNAGVLMVASAGNEFFNNDRSDVQTRLVGTVDEYDAARSYPASYQCVSPDRDWDCIISVASTDSSGNLSWFSNWGQHSVDLAAPGSGILSTIPDATYDDYSGTSMAAPYVTGAIALCKSANPALSPREIRAKLLQTARTLGPLYRKVASDGLLNASSLVQACATDASEPMAGAPSALTAQRTVSAGSVKLSWQDDVTGEFGYRIYSSTTNNGSRCNTDPNVLQATLGPGASAFTVTALSDSTNYCFKVVAFRGLLTEEIITSSPVRPEAIPSVSYSGFVEMHDTFTGVSGAKVEFVTASGESFATFTQNFTYNSGGTYFDTGYFNLRVPLGVSGTVTVTGPKSLSPNDLTTLPQLPIAFELSGDLTPSQDTVAILRMPEFSKFSITTELASTSQFLAKTQVSVVLDDGLLTQCLDPDGTWLSNSGLQTNGSYCSFDLPNGLSNGAVSDSQGNFSFVTLSQASQTELGDPFTLHVTAIDSTNGSISGTLSFSSNQSTTATLALLDPRTLSGFVTLFDGTAVSNAKVTNGHNTAFTNFDGSYSLDVSSILDSEIEVSVEPLTFSGDVNRVPNGLSIFGTLPASHSGNLDVKLPQFHELNLRVLDGAEGTGVQNARIVPEVLGGGEFGCFALDSVYTPSSALILGSQSCDYVPSEVAGAPVLTDSVGEASILLLDDAIQGVGQQVSVNIFEGESQIAAVSVPLGVSQNQQLEVTLVRSPSAPPRPVLIPGTSELTLSLLPPTNSGGEALISYRVFLATFEQGPYSEVTSGTCSGGVSISQTTCTITGLTGGITYFVKYAAENQTFIGAQSESASATPTAPVIVTGGGGGGGGGFFPLPVTNPAASALEQLGSIPVGVTVVLPKDGAPLSLRNETWNFELELGSEGLSESGLIQLTQGQQSPVQFKGLKPGSTISFSMQSANFSDVVTLSELWFRAMNQIEVAAFDIGASGRLESDLKMPRSLAVGDYVLIVQAVDATGQPVSFSLPVQLEQGVDLNFSVWTKRLGSDQGKMYAKNPAGVGKVSFRLNGKEIAWVRAIDATDPKLRRVTDGPMAGVTYLVRTVKLIKGKNALEIFLDGKRIWRTAYSVN